MTEHVFRVGDWVDIVPATSLLDCCQGDRGRLVKREGPGWIVETTYHVCPIVRPEESLVWVSPEALGEEWFNLASSWDNYQTILDNLESGNLTEAEIEHRGNDGNPEYRHFLAVYRSPSEQAKRERDRALPTWVDSRESIEDWL